MDIKKRIRIGDLLIENKFISVRQLELALIEQKKTRRKLCKILIDLGYIEENTLLKILSKQLGIAHIDIKHYPINNLIFNKLPEIFARRFRAIALSENKGKIVVGMTDPTDNFASDEIQKILKSPIEVAAVGESDLIHHLNETYRQTEQAEDLDNQLSGPEYDFNTLSHAVETAQRPTIELLQTLFTQAITMQASDIHIEPDNKLFRIRQRIDGILHEQIMTASTTTSALTTKLKQMAGLKVAENDLPQEGCFSIRVNDKNIDIHLATMPMLYDEAIIMHLLDRSQDQLNFDQLAMPETILTSFKQLINKQHGLVLVTGPSDSGKTTTLYTALTEINHPSTKIITIEERVKYQLPRINQIQVQDKPGLTFLSVLRTTLKHDPDVILIDEMRDTETTNIGLRAAMTGHLVFSTLHTPDAISAVSRLLEMATEGFILASTLQAVLSQRLIRRLCPDCHTPHHLSDQDEAWLKKIIGELSLPMAFHQQQGCQHCNQTGYKGRIAVYELLEMTPELRSCIQHNDNTAFITQAKRQQNFKGLAHNALELAMQGITSLDEVMRLANEINIMPDITSDTSQRGVKHATRI